MTPITGDPMDYSFLLSTTVVQRLNAVAFRKIFSEAKLDFNAIIPET